MVLPARWFRFWPFQHRRLIPKYGKIYLLYGGGNKKYIVRHFSYEPNQITIVFEPYEEWERRMRIG